ncbi:type II restriction endonuclease subunit M [Microbispora rosea subsp. aerata]|nr:N-6 DNA methylase [Microbispora rosea]GGO14549.1 type II restriction endonuclease subunit M [Microbispora rosea subsp. aerata]GIH55548.1 type II restriction endonuclease subunit M [Microbispora rosea subsp. aerata]GLJ86492.1 type II restriction endonuclease subunit M [Microbispora rosea subsp. aerata]
MRRDVHVTAADIARLAGVGRAAVSNWRRRHDDFPEPVGGTSTSPAFSLAEVREWLRGHAEGRDLPPDEWLWQDLRTTVDDDDLADLIADLGAFLVYVQHEADDWDHLAAGTDEEVARELPARVRATCARTVGAEAFPETVPVTRVPLVRSIARLAAERGARDTFEFLRERYFEVHTRRVYSTPAEIVTLTLDLVGDGFGSVLDPACGSGRILGRALERSPGARLLGQDVDPVAARLTAVRLALRCDNARIRAGDSLRADAFPGELVDAVVCNPPFNDRNWGYEELTADPRWEYGLPPRVEPELAWVQHALAHLAPGGVAVLLMPPAVASRRSGRRIRSQLLRRGALRAVIALPQGAVPNVAVGLTLWVLCQPGEGGAPSHVLMVDTSGRPDDYARVAVEAWREFGAGRELDDPGVSRSVPLVDLLDEDVDLTPARYLSTAADDLSPERIAHARSRFADLFATVTGMIPGVGGPPPDELALVPLPELVRRGMLVVEQQTPARPGDEPPRGMPVLTVEDVIEGRPATGAAEHAGAKPIVTRPGDVVMPQIAAAPVARVLAKGDALLGPNLSLLRPDPAVLDPDFLAGFLCASVNVRHYSAMSSRYRVDVRRAEVPLLPMEEQRRYGEAFRRLAEFRAALCEAMALGEELAVLVADGLTHGVVRPCE